MENKDRPINPVFIEHSLSAYNYSEFGLTKREYFAGLAMQGLLANASDVHQQGFAGNTPMPIPEVVIKLSIEMADELLKQLGCSK